jgi:Cu/Ag efflux pump CusA
VRNCGSHIGQALLSDEVVGIYFGENWISVDPSVDYDETLARVQEVVDGYPGIYRDVQTYLKERIREVLTGGSGALVIRVKGDDLDTIRETAETIEQAIGRVDGIVEEHVELQDKVPQVQVEVDLATAQRHGLKPGDVRRASGVLMASEEVGDLFFGGRAYDVNVWSTPETRNSLTSIRALPIDTPSGEQIALGDVADVSIRPTPNVIERWDLTRTIDVEANVGERDLGSVAHDVEEALETVDFPLGTSAEVLGEYEERQTAQQRLLLAGIVAGIGIFLLLQASFRSWRLATLAFLTLPMALVGGALAVWLGDGTVSLGSLVGFFTVLGIAARNGILMINHFQHLEQFEGETFGPTLVLRGARERLSPILMTTLATALALVPLVIAGRIPGHEIEHPLAIVVLGGLVTSTLLNLFVVPALYLRFGRPREALTLPRTAA